MIFHISDTHTQPDYFEGADPARCCSAGSGSAGRFGDYKCRSPYSVLASALAAGGGSTPALVFWTGDAISMYPNQAYTREGVQFLLENTTKALLQLQQATGARVLPAIGNHDTFPQFQYPAAGSWWVSDLVAEIWKPFVGSDPAAVATLQKGGYYAVSVDKRLRVISLNSVLYYVENKMVPLNDTDPAGQFAWLRDQLAQARSAGQKVYVLSHVPPNNYSNQFHGEFVDAYVDAFKGYHDIVLGEFSGHQHIDYFGLVGDSSSPAMDFHVSHLAGHVGGDTGINPNWRTYEFNAENYQLLDWTTYIMNISDANERGRIEWSQLYRASELLGVADLSPKSMLGANTKLASDRELLKKMVGHTVGDGPSAQNPCDEKCYQRWICASRCSHQADFARCMQTQTAN